MKMVQNLKQHVTYLTMTYVRYHTKELNFLMSAK